MLLHAMASYSAPLFEVVVKQFDRRPAAEAPGLRGPGPEGALTAAADVLTERGYEPQRERTRGVHLKNCPFQEVADQAGELVCAINRALPRGRALGSATTRCRPCW
jgi:predicted ArsR family transcriptional regulator